MIKKIIFLLLIAFLFLSIRRIESKINSLSIQIEKKEIVVIHKYRKGINVGKIN